MKSLNLLIAAIQAEMEANEPKSMITNVSDNKGKIEKLITDLKGDYGSRISMIGSRTGWGSDWATLHQSTGLYNIYGVNTKLINGEFFKFRVDSDWTESYGGEFFSVVHENMDTVVTTDQSNNFEVAGNSDEYTVSVKLDMFNKTLTISPGYILGIVGPFTEWGGMPDYKMTEGPYNVWTGSYDSSNVNEFKFRLNNSWGFNFGVNGVMSGANINEIVPGNYRYTFDVQQYINANFSSGATYENYKKVHKSSYVYKNTAFQEYPENVYSLEILLETTDSILLTEQKSNVESGLVEVLGTYGGTLSNTENVYTVSQEPITVSQRGVYRLIMDVNAQTISVLPLTSGASFNITLGETTIEFTEPDLGYFKLENTFVNELSFTLGASLDISAFTINSKPDTISEPQAVADSFNKTFTTTRLTSYTLYININDFEVAINEVKMLPAKSMTIELGSLYNTISLSYEVPAGILDDDTQPLFADVTPGIPLLPCFWVLNPPGVLYPPSGWPNGVPVVEYIKPTSSSAGGFWTYINVLPSYNMGTIPMFNNGSKLTGDVYTGDITKHAVTITQTDNAFGDANVNYEVSQSDTIKTSSELIDFSSWTVDGDVSVDGNNATFNFTESSVNSSITTQTVVNRAVTHFAAKFAITGTIGLIQMKIKQVLDDGTVANEYEAFLNQYANIDENGNGRFSLPVFANTTNAYCVAEILSMPKGSTGSIVFSECVLVTHDIDTIVEPTVPDYELRLSSDVLEHNSGLFYKKVELKIKDGASHIGGFKLKFNKDLNTTAGDLNVFKLLTNELAQKFAPISGDDKPAYTTAQFLLDKVTPVVNTTEQTTTVTLQGNDTKYFGDYRLIPAEGFTSESRPAHDWSQWTPILILADSDQTIFADMTVEVSQPSKPSGAVIDVELFEVHN